MAYPKDLPKTIRGLWDIQYKPREKVILNNLDSKQKNSYNKLSWSNKIRFIDNLNYKGVFD